MAGEDGANVTTVALSVASRWAIATPLPEREDRLPLAEATRKWNQIFTSFSASSESAQDEVFAAVNLYFLTNGCSPAGAYSRSVKTAGGVSAPASDVVRVTGRLDGEIRQFLRARLKDSYECLKYSPTVKNDDALRDKAERRGVPRDKAFIMADWLKGCEYFTAEEADLAEKLSVKVITEANMRYAAAGKKNSTRVSEIVEVDTVEGAKNGQRYEPQGSGFSGAAY